MRIQLAVAVLAVSLAACSGGDQGKDNGCNHEGELSTVGARCPAMYDGTEANLPACWTDGVPFPVHDRSVWQCQDLHLLQFWWGLGELTCYYDTTSQALVG